MSDARRPDPAELLARLKRAEARAGLADAPSSAGHAEGPRRGRLKVFFGMAPGVGKTYAMLAAAQRLATEGVDVVVGIVETHGRSETEQIALGLDLLPRRSVEYRPPAPGDADGAPAQQAQPIRLHEFDLDAALARRPDVLLIDELAHTNAPGSRHQKRWQDVEACLQAGINVYTTLNVQHLESLNDIIAQITGVTVRETIPDSVVENADAIELVDLPPEALLERLKAGKVYVPEAAAHALERFFRTGNLAALRQLALRRTAEWVDERMQEYKHDEGIRAIWPAADRILVAVSPSPASAKLVRAAKRMAAGLRADLIAVYVEGPGAERLPHADRERVVQSLRLAESLGAETAILPCGPGGSDASAELVAFARARNVTRIVIGKTQRSRGAEIWGAILGRRAFTGEVIRASREIDVHVIEGDAAEGVPTRPAEARHADRRAADAPQRPRSMRVTGYLGAVALIALGSAIASLAYRPPDMSEEAMLLLGGVVITALWFGRGPAVFASVLAVLAFNYFFTEPRFTLYVSDGGYILSFGVMLAVGLLVGTLAARTRRQAETARDRERRTASLYAMARQLAACQSLAETATIGTEHVATAFDADTIVAITEAGAPDGVRVLAASGAPDWLDAPPARDRSVARWVLDNGRDAGLGTGTLAGTPTRFLPLGSARGRVGVLAVRPRTADAQAHLLATDRLLLLETFAGQIATAMERVQLIDSRQAARLEAEGERLRSALLSSVSHDLRTPLAGIAGSASTLRESGDQLDAATRIELIDSIVEEAQRLNDLIANLVFATRLESGAVELNRQWTTIEEIIGSGLSRLREPLSHRPLRTLGISDLPMVKVDNALLPVVIHNLVENALRYTAAGTPLSISAWRAERTIVVKIADEGPGIAEAERGKVFERFFRGRTARLADGAAGRGGMGLGLTICEGIVRAHGGRIWVEANQPHGVAFLFSLPAEESQPDLRIEAPDAIEATITPAAQEAHP